MSKHLVFVGAGHAHLTAITNMSRYLEEGYKVTVISAGAYHYYSGMGPGMLAGTYKPQEIRFNVKQLTESRGGEFIEDIASSINPARKVLLLKNGARIGYDVISFNTGSEIAVGPIDTSYDNVFKVKPIENLYTARCKIIDTLRRNPANIVVIGGGPAGVEIANNVWRIPYEMKARSKITLISRNNILKHFSPKARKLAVKSMLTKGIVLEENAVVKGNTRGKLILENNREIPYDFAFVATGTKPTDIFLDSGLPTGEDGGLSVNEYLQSPQYPEIFGGGDCINFKPRPLDRVGVYAVRQNSILMENLYASLYNGKIPLQTFSPQNTYLLILNMGDGRAIFNRKSLTFGGKLAFRLKDYIDRKFMNLFQLSGEQNETLNCDIWKTENTEIRPD